MLNDFIVVPNRKQQIYVVQSPCPGAFVEGVKFDRFPGNIRRLILNASN